MQSYAYGKGKSLEDGFGFGPDASGCSAGDGLSVVPGKPVPAVRQQEASGRNWIALQEISGKENKRQSSAV